MQSRLPRFADTSRASATSSLAYRSPSGGGVKLRSPRGGSPRKARMFSIPASSASSSASTSCARLTPEQVTWAIASISNSRLHASTASSVLPRVDPPAPQVTLTKVGASGRKSRTVSKRAWKPSSVLGGKNSNEKTGSPLSAANRRRSEISMGAPSGPLLPGSEIQLLLRSEPVDPDAHRVQLEPRDLPIDLRGHRVDRLLEASSLLHHVLGGERLVGEAHVHHARRVPLRGGEVDETSFAEERDPLAVRERVLVEEIANLALAALLLQPLAIHFDVEVAAVRDDGAVLHALEVLARQHGLVAGHRAEEVPDRCGVEGGHDPEAVHGRLERLQRIDLRHHHVGAHALCSRREAATAPSVAEHHEDLAGDEAICRPDDPVNGGLSGAVAIVEHVLGKRVVHRDYRKRELPARLHGAEPHDARRRLLRAADHSREQLAAFADQRGDEIATVVHRDLRTQIERAPQVIEVGLPILGLDGEYREPVRRERGGDVVLGGERIGGAEDDVGASRGEGHGEIRCLAGQVQARGDANALQRPLPRKPLANAR